MRHCYIWDYGEAYRGVLCTPNTFLAGRYTKSTNRLREGRTMQPTLTPTPTRLLEVSESRRKARATQLPGLKN